MVNGAQCDTQIRGGSEIWDSQSGVILENDYFKTIAVYECNGSVGIGVTNEGLTIQIYLTDGAVGVGVDSVSTAIGVYVVDGSVAIGVTEEGSSTQLYKADGDIVIGVTLNGSTVAVINANGVVDMSVDSQGDTTQISIADGVVDARLSSEAVATQVHEALGLLSVKVRLVGRGLSFIRERERVIRATVNRGVTNDVVAYREVLSNNTINRVKVTDKNVSFGENINATIKRKHVENSYLYSVKRYNVTIE